jgi:hypothetical protein
MKLKGLQCIHQSTFFWVSVAGEGTKLRTLAAKKNAM